MKTPENGRKDILDGNIYEVLAGKRIEVIVTEDEVIEPYDESMKDKTAMERREWADRV
ncbi:MAG: hypothetical protein L5655_01265 [Thermosediminibacteraceae bacterium]|nr:hypothetical protein [Thermosediminibacteraceae bacterium]